MKIPAYQAWMEKAECRDEDPELFFAPSGERGSAKDARIAAAKAICARCPMLARCGMYVIANEPPSHRHGIWAGLTEDERYALANQPTPAEAGRAYRRRTTAAREHGTTKGFRQHRLAKEEPCPSCRRAFGMEQAAREYSERAERTPLSGARTHGTERGYRQHRRVGEVPCSECTAAASKSRSEYRARKRAAS